MTWRWACRKGHYERGCYESQFECKSADLHEIVTHLPESNTVKHEKISGELDVTLRLLHVTVDI